MRRSLIVVLSVLPLLLSGCAFGVTNVRVAHSGLKPLEVKREEVILVKKFTDARKEDKSFIGTKRNGFGMPLGNLGIRDAAKLQDLITIYFAEALTAAGFKTIVEGGDEGENSRVDAIIEGEIRKFWLDLYMATWHELEVNIRMLDADSQVQKWEKNFTGKQTNVLWVGVKSEFEKVIREALDDALTKAVKEFGSEEFVKEIQRNPSITLTSETEH